MERLNRRELLKISGWAGALITITGIDTAYGRRIGLERHPLNPDVNFTLSSQSETITPFITFRNFEEAKSLGASGHNFIPKPEGFARMLLAMAYYEDGQDGVSKTLNAVSKRGLEIVLGQPMPGTKAHVLNPLVTPGRPYTITVDPAYLLSGISPLPHELYHVHQYIRDGMGKPFLINGLAFGAFMSLHSLISHFVDMEKHIGRRKFLSGAVKWGISVLLFIQASPALYPYENQAYTQTDESIPDTLAADPYFQFDSSDLFDFQK
ncbi:hypothetical protein HYU95_04685 [Candidatus Daviesbacteria bacterium]|nr:hypothetical protein [Candidatus Daviesbacteria bacterium]